MTEWMFVYLLILLLVGVGVLLWLAWGVLDSQSGTDEPDRNCPVCGRSLRSTDSLIARRLDESGPDRWEVQGCTHCLDET